MARPHIPPAWAEDSLRRAAMEESGDGFCALCDYPIPLKENGNRVSRFHCGKAACVKEWRRITFIDSSRAARKRKKTA